MHNKTVIGSGINKTTDLKRYVFLDSPLIRILPPAYSDGSYSPAGKDRPNPFRISDAIFKGSTGFSSTNHKTALLVFFGKS